MNQLFLLRSLVIVASLFSFVSCGPALHSNDRYIPATDSNDSKTEYFYGTSRIYLPAKNGVPEDEISYVHVKQVMDIKLATVQTLNTVIFDLQKPCDPEVTVASLKVTDIDAAASKAKLTFTELTTYDGALKELQTRPATKSHHGEMIGKPWAWTENHSVVLGNLAGETHRFVFDEVKANGELTRDITYGLCLNKECVDPKKGFTVEFRLKNQLKSIPESEYLAKTNAIKEFNEKHLAECRRDN